ncbi:MAG: hypothetical protein ACUVSW_09870 [Roseiflexus sp.]
MSVKKTGATVYGESCGAMFPAGKGYPGIIMLYRRNAGSGDACQQCVVAALQQEGCRQQSGTDFAARPIRLAAHKGRVFSAVSAVIIGANRNGSSVPQYKPEIPKSAVTAHTATGMR